VPIDVGHGQRVHFLVSHPTPPVFDGPEDRNGRRNHDEIRFWSDYVTPGAGRYIYDDNGRRGGVQPGERFVIAGDMNADPVDGDSTQGAIQQLLDNPRINTSDAPTSPGGPEQSALQGGANATQHGDPALDTADFADTTPGDLRTDYVLPDRFTRIDGSFVFWPLSRPALRPRRDLRSGAATERQRLPILGPPARGRGHRPGARARAPLGAGRLHRVPARGSAGGRSVAGRRGRVAARGRTMRSCPSASPRP
jgi:hypothetical protein